MPVPFRPFTSALLIAMLATACAATPTAADGTPPPVSSTATDLRRALTGEGAWRLTQATDARGQRIDALFGQGADIRLQFVDDRVSVLGVCNHMGGPYRLGGGKLQVGPLMSTRMACKEPLMQAEAAIGRLLEQPALLQLREMQPLQLVLQPESGEMLLFDALPLE